MKVTRIGKRFVGKCKCGCEFVASIRECEWNTPKTKRSAACPECGWEVDVEEDMVTKQGFDAAKIQPTPNGSGTPIVDLVKIDLDRRAFVGEQKYGEKLKAFNGRDALMDAYQESLDLACYLRQAIEERDYGSH